MIKVVILRNLYNFENPITVWFSINDFWSHDCICGELFSYSYTLTVGILLLVEMASDRLRLPPSPRGRTSPTRRRGSAASETRPDGLKILQQIQTTYLPPSDLPMSASRSTTGSQIAPDRNKHEDIRTIKEKVRKTDCLTGKGLLAADLIKNLQSQKNLTAARPFNRAVSAGVHERRPVTDVKQMQRPRSENSNQRTASNGFNSGRRCSLPAPTLKQKARVADDILRKYNCGDETNNKALTQSSNTEVGVPYSSLLYGIILID